MCSPVELQALRGLHALLLKYPEQMAASPAVLSVWAKPVMSRLRSSDRATREQARLLLEEVARHQNLWTSETANLVHASVGEYVLPAMKTLVDRDKHVEALHVWMLTVSLMHLALVEDLTVLNAVLYVPENAMGHAEAAVRLVGLQAWSRLVDAFCATDRWLFKKSVVQLLVQPVVVALEVEPMLNVVHAAFQCWKKLVDAAVRAFNSHYHDAHSVEDAQQDALRWKRWLDEIVRVPVSTLLASQARSLSNVKDDDVVLDDGLARSDDGEAKLFFDTVASMWSVEVTSKEREAQEGLKKASSLHARDVAVDSGVSVIGSNAIGLAFLLPDVFAMVQTFVGYAEATDASISRTKQRARDLAVSTWSGFCSRIWTQETLHGKPDKLRLRLARLCLDFALGASSSSSGTSYSDSQRTMAMLPVEWQVFLLTPLVTSAPTHEVVTALMLHSKSRIHQCVVARLVALQDSHQACGAVVRRYFAPDKTSDGRLSMAQKDNVLLLLTVNLMLESAVAIDAKSNPSLPEEAHFVISVCKVCQLLLDTARATGEFSSTTALGWRRVIGFVDRCVKAGDVLASSEKDDQLNSQAWHGFISLCTSATEEDEVPVYRMGGASNASVASLKDGDTDSFSALEVKTDVPMPGTPDASASQCVMRSSLPVAVASAMMAPRGSPFAGRNEATGTNYAGGERPEPVPQPSPEQSTQRKRSTATSINKATGRNPEPRSPMPDQLKRALEKSNQGASTTTVADSPRHPGTPMSSNSLGIYPALAKCTESISQIYRHFPLAFRPFFSFYKVKSIGDLSSMPTAKVKTFGIKDPVETVLRALEEFDARLSRTSTSSGAPNSPFRQLTSPGRRAASANSTPTTPSRSSPSPRRSAMGKRRAGHAHHRAVSPMRMESPHRKRVRRSLDELNGDGDGKLGDKSPVDPKLADRVTFRLPTGEGDATHIARPGEESQDQSTAQSKDEEDDASDKMSAYMLKLLQHLRRSAYYVDKIAAEEESLQSDASLRTDAAKMDGVLKDFQEAHQLVATLSQQLHIVANASAQRCRRILDRAEAADTPQGT